MKRDLVKFIVTLKSGGDFKPFDAISLCRQVKRHLFVPHEFICMTDMEIDHPWVKSIPLKDGHPGWWSMVEMFRNPGPAILSGLDMLVIGCLDRLAEAARTCPENVFYMTRPIQKKFQWPGHWRSGLQVYNGDWSWLYEKFDFDKATKYHRGEEDYTQANLKKRGIEIRAVQDIYGNGSAGMYSYKFNCRDRGIYPGDARIIFFHGRPRPCEVGDQWVRDIYWNEEEYEHPFEALHRMEHGDERSERHSAAM